MAWQQKGHLVEDAGDVGKEAASGRTCARRFVNPDLPNRLITLYAYPVREEDGMVHLRMCLEFRILLAGRGTIGWSHYHEDRSAIPGVGTVAEAEALGLVALRMYNPADLDWNGSPF